MAKNIYNVCLILSLIILGCHVSKAEEQDAGPVQRAGKKVDQGLNEAGKKVSEVAAEGWEKTKVELQKAGEQVAKWLHGASDESREQWKKLDARLDAVGKEVQEQGGKASTATQKKLDELGVDIKTWSKNRKDDAKAAGDYLNEKWLKLKDKVGRAGEEIKK